MIEHAVAIEEHGRPSQLLVQLALGAREIIGDADVDEIAAIGRSAQLAARREAGEYVVFERSRELPNAGKDGFVDDIDAGMYRSRGAGTRGNEVTHHITIERNAPVAIADDAVAQRHVSAAAI